jgi:hypothetical protein
LLSLAALAHDVRHPRREALRIGRDGVTLLVDYEIAAGPRAQAMRQARLSPQALAQMATLRTELWLDGQRVELQRRAVRGENFDAPAESTALLAVRVELHADWPPQTFWQRLFSSRRVELRDVDESGHVPVAAECVGCRISEASSGVADGPYVRAANTPLVLAVKI